MPGGAAPTRKLSMFNYAHEEKGSAVSRGASVEEQSLAVTI